jgi:flagellar protein FlgJ
MTLAPLTGAYAANSAAIAKQARSFETMAISQLLQPIFDTVSTPSPLFGGSQAEKTWQPFLLNAIATQMEADGGLGLANQIAAALKEKPVQ